MVKVAFNMAKFGSMMLFLMFQFKHNASTLFGQMTSTETRVWHISGIVFVTCIAYHIVSFIFRKYKNKDKFNSK